MMKPMKDYIPLLTVKSENITIPKLSSDQLDTRALDKLDSKIFFKKKKLNELARKIGNSIEFHELEFELIQLQYESNYRDYLVLEYIYKKINVI